jgi:SpoVK/Ycf46/Vps4 family AAA+-type ATPase
MGSLVGQTEERTRQVLRLADAVQPCLLMIDELDKAFAGVAAAAPTSWHQHRSSRGDVCRSR